VTHQAGAKVEQAFSRHVYDLLEGAPSWEDGSRTVYVRGTGGLQRFVVLMLDTLLPRL